MGDFFLGRSTARSIIYIFMSCYKAGLKDAEYVSDEALCEDFKETVRHPGVFGVVRKDYTLNQRDWRITLLFINGDKPHSQYDIDLLQNIKLGKSVISCVLPIAQEFYIMGLDDYNSYPQIHDFTLMDNARLQRWTRKGIEKLKLVDIVMFCQKFCMERAAIDAEEKNKFSIKRLYYELFSISLYTALCVGEKI